MTGQNNILFELRHVTKSFRKGYRWLGNYQEIQALRDVSLSIDDTTPLGIVGESGSGKSTLAKILLGLIEPESGNISFCNQVFKRYYKRNPREFLQKVQFVFQDPLSSLNPKRRIRPQLEAPLIHLTSLNAAERNARIQETLARVRLDYSVLDRFPHAFSGGQAQRIAIARALVTQPQLLILDEAVSSLDVSVQATILNLLKSLQKELQLNFVLIAHDIAVVEYLCPEIVVMHRGEIVESGRRESLIHQPAHPYTRRLIESIYSLT